MTLSTRPFTGRSYLGYFLIQSTEIGWPWYITSGPEGELAEPLRFRTAALAEEHIRGLAYDTYLITACLPDGTSRGDKQIAPTAKKAALITCVRMGLPVGTYVTVDGKDGTCHFTYGGGRKIG
jgi:hypothetical protein